MSFAEPIAGNQSFSQVRINPVAPLVPTFNAAELRSSTIGDLSGALPGQSIIWDGGDQEWIPGTGTTAGGKRAEVQIAAADGTLTSNAEIYVRDPTMGSVDQVTIVSAGSGYSAASNPHLTTATTGLGNGLTLNVTVNGSGGVTAIQVVDGGFDYTFGELVTINGGNGDATVSIAASFLPNNRLVIDSSGSSSGQPVSGLVLNPPLISPIASLVAVDGTISYFERLVTNFGYAQGDLITLETPNGGTAAVVEVSGVPGVNGQVGNGNTVLVTAGTLYAVDDVLKQVSTTGVGQFFTCTVRTITGGGPLGPIGGLGTSTGYVVVGQNRKDFQGYTDGTGWQSFTSQGGIASAAGNQGEIQFNTNNQMGASSNLVFDTTVTPNQFNLTASSNIIGQTLFGGDLNISTPPGVPTTIAQFDSVNGIQMQTSAVASGIDLLSLGGAPIKIDADGLLTLESGNNDVRVRTVNGTIDATATGSGALNLGTLGTGNLELKTNQGSLIIGSTLSGVLDLQTNTGNLQLRTLNAPLILQSGGAANGISLTTTSAGAPIDLTTQLGSKITLTTNLEDIDLVSGADVNVRAAAAGSDINLLPDDQVRIGDTGGTDGTLSLTDGTVDRIVTSGTSARIEQTGLNGQPALVNRVELAAQGDANGAAPSTSQSGTTIYTRGGVEILPNMFNGGVLNAPMNGSTIRLGRYGWLPTSSIYQGAEVELSVASSPITQGGSGNLYCNLVRENIFYYDASGNIGPTFPFGANGNGGVGQYYNGGNLQHILCQVGNQAGYFLQVTLPTISEALVGSTITVVRLFSNPTFYPGNNAIGIPRSEVAVVVVPSGTDLISGPPSIVATYPGFPAGSLAADPFLQIQNDPVVISAPTIGIGAIKLVASRAGDGQTSNLPVNTYIWHYIGEFPGI